jgi:hypothetical protein
MAENGIQYSTGNTLNFTTNNTTWATLTSGGTFQVSSISATTYSNIPSSGGGTFTGGTVSGATNFISGLTANTFSATTATIRRIIGGSGNTSSGIYNFIGGGTNHTMGSLSCNSSIVSGVKNTICGPSSFIGSGSGNTNNGTYSFIGAGCKNYTVGAGSFVGGGYNNFSTGNCTLVVGGDTNCTVLPYAAVVGGNLNIGCGVGSFIGNGYRNETYNNNGFIGNGFCNINTGSQYFPNSNSVIVGGQYNRTNSGYYGPGSNFIGAGDCNILTGSYSTISGGYKNNHGSGFYSFIGGGTLNTFSSIYDGDNQSSSIVGGYSNTIYRGQGSVIAGGSSNRICGGFAGSTYICSSFIGAGYCNMITLGTLNIHYGSSIAGGGLNCISVCNGFIGGGGCNIISGITGEYSTISGGYKNTVGCNYSFIGSGRSNRITTQYSGILGGSGNTVSGAYSFAAGCGLNAVSARTFYANNIIVSGTSTSQSTSTAFDFYSSQSSGDEGGELRLNKPATNSTISGVTTIDMFQNKLRFFESGGSSRGAFIDLTRTSSGVGTNLIVPRISSGVDSSGNTTTGAFTIVSSVVVSANTFTTGDTVSFKVRMRKSATNGTVNYRISSNTTLNLTGSQTVGVFNAGATIIYGELERTLIVKGATSEVFNTSITNVQSDVTTSTSSVSSLSIDWTVDQYIMFNINQSSASDTTTISYYSIRKI